jgi:hypothetical protein
MGSATWPVFRLLVGEPLNAEEVKALGPHGRAMYLITRIKTHKLPVAYDQTTNTTGFTLAECIWMVCQDISQGDRAELATELVDDGWAVPIDARGCVRFKKSDNITSLMVALLIYNEGSWVRYGTEEMHKPNFE